MPLPPPVPSSQPDTIAVTPVAASKTSPGQEVAVSEIAWDPGGGKPDPVKTFTFNDKHCYELGQYVIGEFNLNGIKSIVNPYNVYFKKYVVSSMYFDFLILPEHHCLPDESFELENYKIYQNNRPILGGGVRRGSGGIAIAINLTILETHTVVSVTKGVDGQISVKLRCNFNDFIVGPNGDIS